MAVRLAADIIISERGAGILIAILGKSGKIALRGYFLSVYVSGGLKQGKTEVITGYNSPK